MPNSQSRTPVDAVAEVCADLIREGRSFRYDADTCTIVMLPLPPSDLDLIKLSMGHADPEKVSKEEVANLYTRPGEWTPPSEIVRTCTAKGLAELHARGLLIPREFPTPLEIKPDTCQK